MMIPGTRQAAAIGLAILLAALIGGLPGCAGARAAGGSRASAGAGEGHRVRGPSDWFLQQRRDGAGNLPPRARARALEAARAARILLDAPGLWTSAGPANVGGRVTCVGVDPHDPARLWVGTAEGGVFTSADGGTTWTPVFDGQTALSIGALAVHPDDPGTLYVGTGEDNGGGFSYDGEGVFKTTDGGQTWTSLGLSEVRRIGRIAIDPVDPRRIFVAAGGDWFRNDPQRGLYRSIDGGATWEQVLYVGDDAGAIDVVIDPGDTDRVYAAIWQRLSLGSSWYISGLSSGIHRSIDGGTTWSRLSNGLPAGPNVGRIGLAIAPSNPSVLYAVVVDGSGLLLGLYRTTDGGDSWALRTASVPQSGFSYYFGNVRVDPANADIVYLLDQILFRSTNGGLSFSQIAQQTHPDWHDLILQGSRLLAGNDAGFFKSENGGASWTQAAMLPITQVYDLGIDRLQPGRRFAGAQDVGTVRTQTGGLADWQLVLFGDGLQCEVDYTNSNYVYAEAQYGDIRKSKDGGRTFTFADSGIDQQERTNWNTPITLDPVVPTTLYTGAERVYRSTNRAGSWSPISPDLTNGPTGGGGHAPHRRARHEGPDHLMNLVMGTITVVSVSPVDTRILWAGTDDGNVWVTANSGALWTQVNPPGPAYWVTDIGPDPFEARTAYLTASGFRLADRLPYVRVTHDLGATWEDRSGGLPQIPFNSVLPDPAWRGRLFLGSDLGVHLSDDGGFSWSMLRGGMPYVVVADLVLHQPTRTLYAGTHGRSIYAYDLDQLPPPDGDGDGVDNNTDCAWTDAGAFALPPEAGPLAAVPAAGGDVTLSWPSQSGSSGPDTLYDVAAGDLASLASAGTGASTALACGLSSLTASDPTLQPRGAGRYYMVRGRNVCGTGTWGSNSTGTPRTSPACP